MRALLTVGLIGILLALAAAQGDPRDLPRVQSANIVYLGSFALPEGDFGGSRFGYGGKGLCFYREPSGTPSLFLQGHDWYPGFVAQVSVPDLGGTATVLQEFRDVTDGALATLATSDSFVYGMMVYDGRLIVGASCYYDGDASQVNSHGVSGLNLAAPDDFQGFYPVAAEANPRSLGGYMTVIPAE